MQYTIDTTIKAVKALGLRYELVKDDHTDPHWIEKQSNNKHYHIRIASVDIGGAPENWVIEMMFCSKLGVSFPDPSGRICKLVEQTANSILQLNLDQYSTKFNEILLDDASVLPVMHAGYTWFIGDEIDTSSLTATSVVPRIELIRFK